MGGFFSSIFGGSDPTLGRNIKLFGQEAGQESGLGSGLTTDAAKWYESILSGDPTQEASAIAPESAALTEEAQQKKNELAQFAPRSGGTAAATDMMDANTRAQIFKLLGGLKSVAAAGAAGLGTTEQGLSLSAKDLQDRAAQEQRQNWMNSIIGQAIGTGIGSLEEFGLGKIGL
jgi:hypothetical protein